MASGPTASHFLNLGAFVSIPVKSFPAARDKSTELVNLHRKCIEAGVADPSFNQLKKCKGCGDILTNEQTKTDVVKGYEAANGGYHLFNNEEIEALAATESRAMDIVGFFRFADIDPVLLGRANYLGPLKQAEKPFGLLHALMRKEGLAALVTYYGHGRDKIGVIRPSRDTLMLHDAFFATEVREYAKGDRGWMPPAQIAECSASEMKLGAQLVANNMLDSFETAHAALRDGYLDRVAALITAREEGAEPPVFAKAAQPSPVIDLMAALEASLNAGPKAAPATPSKPPVKIEAEKKAPAKKRKSA